MPAQPTPRSIDAGLKAAAAIGARVAEALAVVWLLASLVFFALRILPGDPAALVLGDDASPAELARLRALLHMDRPLPVQYLEFLRGLATLDLGESLRRPGVKAMARVFASLGPTSALAGVAVLIGAALGIAAARVADADPGRDPAEDHQQPGQQRADTEGRGRGVG